MKISLHKAITSLTCTLDFVGVDDVHHGKRVGLLAHGIAGELGWETVARQDILYAGMLHDCGVSRIQEHRQLTQTLEWEGADEHCLRGEAFLRACPPLARFATPTRWHHTRWELLQAMDLPEIEKQRANLIYLADRADVLLAPYLAGGVIKDALLWEHPAITGRLASLSGSLFCPEMVDALVRAAAREGFWLCMDGSYIIDEIEDRLHDDLMTDLDTRDTLAVAHLFARTVDAKSSYTLEHSTRVAQLVRFLAEASGVRGGKLDQMEIAGLLHDIGKLRVPEEIIDKPGAITLEERALVKRHSFDTGRILKNVFPGQPIADWASMHHENLLGTGYPGHLAAVDIPPEARLIAVADIFQALAQNRPYRQRLPAAAVMAKLDELCALGRIDGGVVELVRRHLDRCYQLATA